MKDPHKGRLPKTTDEYADKDYQGLYAFPLDGKTYVARMRWMREGMGREFFDPESDNYIGFCGSDWANANVKQITIQPGCKACRDGDSHHADQCEFI